MVRVLANGTINRVIAINRQLKDGGIGRYGKPCAVFVASFAGFDSTRQLLPASRLYNDIPPSLIQNFLDLNRYIDYLICRDDIIKPMNITVIQLLVPKAVL